MKMLRTIWKWWKNTGEKTPDYLLPLDTHDWEIKMQILRNLTDHPR